MSNQSPAPAKEKGPSASIGSNVLHVLLLVSFVVTMLVPLTGIVVHKLASVLFLLLCVIHAVMFRKRMDWQKFAVLGLVLLDFLSGLFGMILDQYPIIMDLHKVISIACVFFLAIHIFIFRRRLVSR